MNVVVVSAKTEWGVIKYRFKDLPIEKTPYGVYFKIKLNTQKESDEVALLHGGFGKVNAAGSVQYVIDKFSPKLIVNLGTCGGFEGDIERGEIILAEKTIIYDIYERINSSDKAIVEYTTDIDLSWLSDRTPLNVKRSLLISGDGDLDPQKINQLKNKYCAIAGDWESGAIAHVCKLNNIRCLILRGVSDLVSEQQGEVYGNPQAFLDQTKKIMNRLIDSLPDWFNMFYNNVSHDK